MIYLYAIQLEKNNYEDEILTLLPILSEERRTKTIKYRHFIDQIRCILGEVLVRYVLWRHYAIQSEEIHFQYNKYGKPSLKQYKNINFNISHSGVWVLCGVSDNLIGIDIECATENDIISIASFRHSNEVISMYENGSLNEDYFFRLISLNNKNQVALCSFQNRCEIWGDSVQKFLWKSF